ncbi:MAG: dihydrolipoamide acetyltransferase family protein [Candidatus Acidiferrum sp.]|jgi:pyruvate dehydrogenase E2 component (dihydrolipoamide acetyltransferase)
MAISVVMPALEMAQETGKLLAWRKQEGEQVTKGEPLLEIETDKAVVEVEAPGDGVLAAITARVGDEIPVGRTIAWLVKPGEAVPAGNAGQSSPSARTTTAPERAAPSSLSARRASGAAVPEISPKARRLAKELGVDFSKIKGTGPDGVITAEDVQAVRNAQPGAISDGAIEPEPLSAVARLMAERTAQSWTTVPHFFVSRDVNAAALSEFQKANAARIEKAGEGKLSITDLLIALVTRVLEKHPRMNSSWAGGTIKPNQEVNMSVAMAVKDGVVSAVIHSAQSKTLREICAKRQELTELARNNRLRPTDISGGTFTISNLGMFKVDAFTAIIPEPQAAILAVGGISDRVVAVDGKPAVCPVMTMTLSSDHRVIDGARAADFLNDLVDAIREPQKWLNL